MNTLVTLSKADGIAVVTLNRAEAMNALSKALRAALAETFVALDMDDDVHVVILTGLGTARLRPGWISRSWEPTPKA